VHERRNRIRALQSATQCLLFLQTFATQHENSYPGSASLLKLKFSHCSGVGGLMIVWWNWTLKPPTWHDGMTSTNAATQLWIRFVDVFLFRSFLYWILYGELSTRVSNLQFSTHKYQCDRSFVVFTSTVVMKMQIPRNERHGCCTKRLHALYNKV
jgi:hypothetical protein